MPVLTTHVETGSDTFRANREAQLVELFQHGQLCLPVGAEGVAA